jgi:hypothetical protein
VPGSRKIHATPRAAYYEIAKQLVVAKYPPQLGDGFQSPESVPDGWSADLADRRRAKSLTLFYSGEFCNGDSEYRFYFDHEKWKRFVWRVARYLRLVDKRRALAEVMQQVHVGLLASEECATLQASYEAAEASAFELLDLAYALQAEIRRRAAPGAR